MVTAELRWVWLLHVASLREFRNWVEPVRRVGGRPYDRGLKDRTRISGAYIYIYMYLYVCIHLHIYIYIHICVESLTYIHDMHTYRQQADRQTDRQTCTTHTHTYIHTYYVRTYMHIEIQTHIGR